MNGTLTKVLTRQWGGGGGGGGNGEMSEVWLKYAKRAVNEKIAGCGGIQQWSYQRAVPAGWGF